jgi:glycosyltransferase involved in cell wall biosynthesis
MELRGARVVVANWRDLDHPLAGGSERYAWELAQGLVASGADVVFLTARERGQRRSERRDGIRIVRRGGRLGYYLLAAWWLLLRRGRLDAVVDMEAGIPLFSPVVVGQRTAVVLFVHHVHLDQFGLYFPRPLAALGRFLEGWLMPRVYRDVPAVAVSESTRTAMKERLGWTGPISVVHNGNDRPAVRAVAPEETVDRVVVLGRLSPHKRVDLVIRAVAAIQESRPALHVDVIGKGPDLPRLRQLVQDLEVEKLVTFHGFVSDPDKAALLSRARLHVCASDVEGWGLVVLEAASYGVPTVARDVPGLRDSVRHQHTGWLVPEQPGDLAAAQARLVVGIEGALAELDDPDRRQEVSTACREWAAQFDWTQMRTRATALVAHTMKGAS